MTRRYLAISLPRLATDRIARQRWGAQWRLKGRPEAPPIVITGKRNNAQRLVAIEEIAGAAGLSCGQGLADARAMLPGLEAIAEDAGADRLLIEAIADWCDRYTPLVAIDMAQTGGDAGLMLDITGCAHLYNGEKEMLNDVLGRLFHQGFAAQAAIAATPGSAWAFARFLSGPAVAHRNQSRSFAVVCAEATGQTLRRLPVGALRLEETVCAGLARVGLRFIGQLMDRPRGPLARRFGKMVLLRLDQATGAVEEAISPRLPAPELVCERRLAEPLAEKQAIEILVHRLAGHLEAALEKRGQGARIIDLALFRVDGHVMRIGVGTSRPLRDKTAIARLFAERLSALGDEVDAGYGFDLIRLSVSLAEPLEAHEPGFLGRQADERPVSDLIDRLGARLGFDRVLTSHWQATHLPEDAERLVPANIALPAPAGERIGQDCAVAAPTRPVRIFECPEPVEALARVPDGPPIRFRWRRILHEILRAEGPERIADQWWHGRPQRGTRDYFRVEDANGCRFWLFREGLYGEETDAPRWYVHGLFA